MMYRQNAANRIGRRGVASAAGDGGMSVLGRPTPPCGVLGQPPPVGGRGAACHGVGGRPSKLPSKNRDKGEQAPPPQVYLRPGERSLDPPRGYHGGRGRSILGPQTLTPSPVGVSKHITPCFAPTCLPLFPQRRSPGGANFKRKRHRVANLILKNIKPKFPCVLLLLGRVNL